MDGARPIGRWAPSAFFQVMTFDINGTYTTGKAVSPLTRQLWSSMIDLGTKISLALANGTSKKFTYYLPADCLPPNASEHTIAYGQIWEVTLHYNNCKIQCVNDSCARGAAQLVIERMKSIAKGMPDLDRKAEDEIWSRAFELHKEHSISCVISPTWAPLSPTTCNCFERAKVEYDSKPRVNTFLVQVDPDDVYYEPRYE